MAPLTVIGVIVFAIALVAFSLHMLGLLRLRFEFVIKRAGHPPERPPAPLCFDRDPKPGDTHSHGAMCTSTSDSVIEGVTYRWDGEAWWPMLDQ